MRDSGERGGHGDAASGARRSVGMGAHDLVLSRAGVDCRPVAGDRPAAHARSGYGARVRRNLLLALLLAAVSVSATLAAAEIALRIRHGGLAARPTSGAGPLRMGDARSVYPSAYDPQLGYVPRAGSRGSDNVWQPQVSIDANGLRENGRPPPPGRPILALGDSFT